MEKIVAMLIFLALISCRNNVNTNNNANDSTHVTYDASKADTTSTPNGVTNSSDISLDTAAYRITDSSKK